MKVKQDFVTNSSSTSFILTCKAEISTKDEFIHKFNVFLENYTKHRAWDDDFQEPPLLTSDMVEQIEPGIFVIRDFVAIYGNEVPKYLQELFLDKDSEAAKDLKREGIIPLEAEIKDLNE